MNEAVPPRRRDRVQTKARILAAARDAFAEIGYPQTGIRDIAARAGITSPMLLHYFGSKIGLFEAALVDSMASQDLYDTPRERFGEHLMAQISNPAVEIQTPALVVLSTGDAEARAVTARVAEENGVRPLADWLGPPDGHARAAQITMLAIAYVLFTRQVPLVELGSDDDRALIGWMAATIQEIVDRG